MGYSFTPDNKISIITELQVMDLSRALHYQNPPLTFKTKVAILREIAEGMKYLHDQGLMHGDLKPSNVVVSTLDTDEMTVKLIDFANDPIGGTQGYATPEILKNRGWSTKMDVDVEKADIYSFGILCQEILVRGTLFEDYELGNYREATLMGRRPPIPIGISLEMECLIQSCWNGDPQERPNFFEVCERLDFVGVSVVAEQQEVTKMVLCCAQWWKKWRRKSPCLS